MTVEAPTRTGDKLVQCNIKVEDKVRLYKSLWDKGGVYRDGLGTGAFALGTVSGSVDEVNLRKRELLMEVINRFGESDNARDKAMSVVLLSRYKEGVNSTTQHPAPQDI